jgi:hypothetical protein
VGTTAGLSLLTNNTVLNATPMPGNEDVPYLVNSDSATRFLHYFPDEVSSDGASHMRLSSWDKLPVGSRLISLASIMPDQRLYSRRSRPTTSGLC